MLIKADFHIHSCLSPCADLEMSPSAIVKKALHEGLNLIAITDHNSSLNCPTLKKLCDQSSDLKCFFGIEVNSIEEVHCLCLFDTLEQVMDFNDFINKNLPDVHFNPEKFGDQVFVDEFNGILGEEYKYLGNCVHQSVHNLLNEVHYRNGLFIPAHVNRSMLSLTSQLGFIPDEDFDALEIYRTNLRKNKPPDIPNINKYPLISDSDSHFLRDIGAIYNEFTLPIQNIKELNTQILKNYLWGDYKKTSSL